MICKLVKILLNYKVILIKFKYTKTLCRKVEKDEKKSVFY